MQPRSPEIPAGRLEFKVPLQPPEHAEPDTARPSQTSPLPSTRTRVILGEGGAAEYLGLQR